MSLTQCGSPLKAGQCMTSATSYACTISLSRPRQGIDMGESRFKEVGKRPDEKTSRRSRAIRSATIEVRQDGPHLIALLGQPALIGLHLGQIAVAPFDCRRSTLKDVDPLG